MTTTHKKRKLALVIGIMVGAAMLIPSGGAQPPEDEGPNPQEAGGPAVWSWDIEVNPNGLPPGSYRDSGALGFFFCEDLKCDLWVFNGALFTVFCDGGQGTLFPAAGAVAVFIDTGECDHGLASLGSLPLCTYEASFDGTYVSGEGGFTGQCI